MFNISFTDALKPLYYSVLISVSLRNIKYWREFAMNNTLTVAEIKRRGMAAIEDGLRHGPVHILKRNKVAAVVLAEDEYQRLAHGKVIASGGMTAMQWLLSQPIRGKRSKARIDADLKAERNW